MWLVWNYTRHNWHFFFQFCTRMWVIWAFALPVLITYLFTRYIKYHKHFERESLEHLAILFRSVFYKVDFLIHCPIAVEKSGLSLWRWPVAIVLRYLPTASFSTLREIFLQDFRHDCVFYLPRNLYRGFGIATQPTVSANQNITIIIPREKPER